jgi:hypothetical protein
MISSKIAFRLSLSLSLLVAGVASGFPEEGHFKDFDAYLCEVTGRTKLPVNMRRMHEIISSEIIDAPEAFDAFGIIKHRSWCHTEDSWFGRPAAKAQLDEALKNVSPENSRRLAQLWPPREAAISRLMEDSPTLTRRQAACIADIIEATHLEGDATTPIGESMGTAAEAQKMLARIQKEEPAFVQETIRECEILQLQSETSCGALEARTLYRYTNPDRYALPDIVRRASAIGTEATVTPESGKLLAVKLNSDSGARRVVLALGRDSDRVKEALAVLHDPADRVLVTPELFESLKRSGNEAIQNALKEGRVITTLDEAVDAARPLRPLPEVSDIGSALIRSRTLKPLLRLLGPVLANPYVGKTLTAAGICGDIAIFGYYSYHFIDSIYDPYAADRTRLRYGIQTGIGAGGLGFGIVCVTSGPGGWIVLAGTGIVVVAQVGTDYAFEACDKADEAMFRNKQREMIVEHVSDMEDFTRQAITNFKMHVH